MDRWFVTIQGQRNSSDQAGTGCGFGSVRGGSISEADSSIWLPPGTPVHDRPGIVKRNKVKSRVLVFLFSPLTEQQNVGKYKGPHHELSAPRKFQAPLKRHARARARAHTHTTVVA